MVWNSLTGFFFFFEKSITTMFVSDSYGEFINHVYSRSQQDGSRPYPVRSYEVFLLDQAQQRAKRREENLFRKLADIFDWNLSTQQRNAYVRKLQAGNTLVLTDTAKTILWASNSFLNMTGYSPTEALGKKPGMLQGPDTDPATVLCVRRALAMAEPISANLVNYRKNGEAYVCQVHIEPLYDNRQKLTHFIAVESEVK